MFPLRPTFVIVALAVLATVSSAQFAVAQQQPVLFPSPGTKNAPPDTPLKITLDSTPELGTGKIEVRDATSKAVVASVNVGESTRTQSIGGLANYVVHPIIVTGKEAAIYLPPHALDYGKSYEVVADPGVLPTARWTAWQFATKAAPPALDVRRIVVASNGTGDFTTIQGAIDFIPEGNKAPREIFIRRGTYNEILCIMSRDNVTFLGEDRKNTVIAYATNDRFNPNAGGNPFAAGAPLPGAVDPKTGAVYRRGVFLVHRVNGLTLANLTIRNTTPKGGSQAETIIFNSSADAAHAILTKLDLQSYQDTVQFNGQAFISDTFIEGDVDFIWGTGPCFFENVHARAVTNGAIFTTVRCPPTNHGFVFKDCTFDGAPGVTGTFLARVEANRFPTSETILFNVSMSSAISPMGWRAPTGGDASNVHFWEFNIHDAEGKPIDMTRRIAASRQLKQPEDNETIARYGDPKFVLGGNWTPALAPLIARAPGDATTRRGASITLEVDAVAIPLPTYQWKKNGIDIPGATKPSLALTNLGPADAAAYTVTVTNSSGEVTTSPAHLSLSE